MRQTFLALAIVVAAAQPLAADPADADIRAVISAQIDAFRAGDVAGAFGYASDGIRQIFRTADNFGTMVGRGYAMVIAPAEVQYGDVRNEGGALVQRVLLRDAAGVWHALDYLMVEQEGGWRIGGVELLAEPPVGA
jgi:hypothetical protein